MEELKDPANFFYTCDGKVLKSLIDVLYYIASTKDENFVYHFNEHKNDFANWVADALKLKEFSKNMSLADSRNRLIKVVRDGINTGLNK